MKPRGLFKSLPESEAGKAARGSSGMMVLGSTLLAVLFLYLALRNLEWRVFFDTVTGAQYAFLPIIFLWGSASNLLRALRLRVLLASEKQLPLSNVFWANMAGYLGNNVLPARAGELIRAGYLARENAIGTSFALAVGLVERLMDLIALIVIGSLALSFAGIVSIVFQRALRGIFAVGLLGLMVIFVLPHFSALAGRLIFSLPLLKETQKSKLERFLQQFLNGLRSLYGFKRAAQFLGLTGFIWLMDALGMLILSFILKIPLLLQQTLVLLAALGISSAIPSTPGYVGVYQFVAVTTLAPFGISRADALAYILISQIVNYLVVGFWGLISLWKFNNRNQP